MDILKVKQEFRKIGARVELVRNVLPRRRGGRAPVTFDIQTDARGEYFQIVTRMQPHVSINVVDVQPRDRHLLALVQRNQEQHRFLCGYDGQHWFVAAVPDLISVATVEDAKEALKPAKVRTLQARRARKLRTSTGRRRQPQDAVYRRQGEWFFVPAVGQNLLYRQVLTNQPLTRGNGSKPHCAEYFFGIRGEPGWACAQYPLGVNQKSYDVILRSNPQARFWSWRAVVHNTRIFVRGRITHPDHTSITLNGWHEAMLSTENLAEAIGQMRFTD